MKNYMKRIVKRLLRGNTTPDMAELEFLEKHGFVHGKNYYCFSPYAIDAGWPFLISIGNDVTISSDVKILAHDASPHVVHTKTKLGRVVIGNNVFIGAGSIVLCNTRIGNNVVIGAGSVVSKNVPDNCVYAGNPAKYVCSIEEFKKKHVERQKEHPVFIKHAWNEWRDAGEDDWNEMREALKDTYGYV